MCVYPSVRTGGGTVCVPFGPHEEKLVIFLLKQTGEKETSSVEELLSVTQREGQQRSGNGSVEVLV